MKADFTDHDALAAAATGVDTIFAMTTPFEAGVDAETAQGLALTQTAKAAGVGHLIYSSVGDADKQTGIPHFDSKYAVEEAIAASGINYTIMAPVFFMDNLMAPFMAPKEDGTLALAMPGDRKLQQVAVADIGAFAAALVERRDEVFGKRYDIAGDELTGHELAAILSESMGRAINYQGFPADAMRAHSEDMALMFEWFQTTGYSADIAGLRRDFPEVGWHDYRSWAKKTLAPVEA